MTEDELGPIRRGTDLAKGILDMAREVADLRRRFIVMAREAADVKRRLTERAVEAHRLRVLLAGEAGELSEGQAAEALGVDRETLRGYREDALRAVPRGQEEG
jgi:hypothetical protein